MSEVIKFTLEKDGFKGTYYEGKIKDKVIIYTGGAGLNEKITNNSSEFLRNQGYSVLVLGFYLWKGLPKEMYHIPVEYVEKAVNWLKEKKKISKIGIMGTSTGAGYILLSASLIPEISCVVAVSPLDYVMEGVRGKFKPQNCSVYKYKGQDVPYTEFNVLHSNLFKELRKFFKNKNYSNKQMNRYAYDIANYTEESRIKVENIEADILLIAPKYDDSWPSTEAVNRIEKILRKNNYSYRVKKVIYEKGSHILGYWKLNKTLKFLMKYMYPLEKKYPLECEKARQESAQVILDFIKEW